MYACHERIIKRNVEIIFIASLNHSVNFTTVRHKIVESFKLTLFSRAFLKEHFNISDWKKNKMLETKTQTTQKRDLFKRKTKQSSPSECLSYTCLSNLDFGWLRDSIKMVWVVSWKSSSVSRRYSLKCLYIQRMTLRRGYWPSKVHFFDSKTKTQISSTAIAKDKKKDWKGYL